MHTARVRMLTDGMDAASAASRSAMKVQAVQPEYSRSLASRRCATSKHASSRAPQASAIHCKRSYVSRAAERLSMESCKSHAGTAKIPSGLKPWSFAGFMYGLKPVPFKAFACAEAP